MTKRKKLTKKQELFCQYYVSEQFFANGTQSYIKAYKIDTTIPGAYDVARKEASRNLTKPHICDRINELLDDAGLNDEFVDKQRLFLIQQHENLAVKRAAIADYDKLTGRIIDRSEVTHKGIQINIGNDKDPEYLDKKKKKVRQEDDPGNR